MSQPPALELRDLRFEYRPGTPVIDIGAFVIGPDEQVLLTGGSGLGKSTLLQLIAGLLAPTRGEVRIAGRSLTNLPESRRDVVRGQSIGMIFQTFNLLPGFSALENVLAAMMFSAVPQAEHLPRARGLLASLGIERESATPEELSVGQQQRVAVARAVACRPVLVLADEPTASLDPENTLAAMDLIQAMCREQGAALLCVSHDPAMGPRFARRESLKDLNAAVRAEVAR